jgi:hypothetical protein
MTEDDLDVARTLLATPDVTARMRILPVDLAFPRHALPISAGRSHGALIACIKFDLDLVAGYFSSSSRHPEKVAT